MLAMLIQFGFLALCFAYTVPLQKRECGPNQVGSGPTVSPDTAAAFVAYQPFAAAATSAITPPGYVNTFVNLLGESEALGFHGWWLLESYNVSECAAMCDNRDGCMAFNIAFERAPSIIPGPDCANPNSTTWIKCTLWGGPVNQGNAINTGQWANNFQIVAAGSNGYINATLMDATGYTGPQGLQDQAIIAPVDCNNKNTALGYTSWNDSNFDAQRCAKMCTATPKCQFFNTYMMIKNYVEVIQMCAMYTETWTGSYATASTVIFNGTSYGVIKSFGYSNTTNPGYCAGASYTSLGCYADSGTRSLGNFAPIPNGIQNSLDVCSCLCAGYSYFGTEYGQECYCGNTLSQAQINGASQACIMQCAGNSSQACGGSWAINVYQQTGTAPTVCNAINVPALQSSSIAGPFCTSYNSYTPSASTTTVYSTTTTTALTCASGTFIAKKRDETEDDNSIIIEAIYDIQYPNQNGSDPGVPVTQTPWIRPSSSALVTPMAATMTAEKRQAISTPSALIGRQTQEISSVCSRIATGFVTATTTATVTSTTSLPCTTVYPTQCTQTPDAFQPIYGHYGYGGVRNGNAFLLTLPFQVGIYGVYSTSVCVSSEGYVGLSGYCSAIIANTRFPAAAFGNNAVVAPLWSAYRQETINTLSYIVANTCGTSPNRMITFKWSVFDYGSDNPVFEASFYEVAPGVLTFYYDNPSNVEGAATVGFQGSNTVGVTYEYNQANSLYSGQHLTYDTRSGVAKQI